MTRTNFQSQRWYHFTSTTRYFDIEYPILHKHFAAASQIYAQGLSNHNNLRRVSFSLKKEGYFPALSTDCCIAREIWISCSVEISLQNTAFFVLDGCVLQLPEKMQSSCATEETIVGSGDIHVAQIMRNRC